MRIPERAKLQPRENTGLLAARAHTGWADFFPLDSQDAELIGVCLSGRCLPCCICGAHRMDLAQGPSPEALTSMQAQCL